MIIIPKAYETKVQSIVPKNNLASNQFAIVLENNIGVNTQKNIGLASSLELSFLTTCQRLLKCCIIPPPRVVFDTGIYKTCQKKCVEVHYETQNKFY